MPKVRPFLARCLKHGTMVISLMLAQLADAQTDPIYFAPLPMEDPELVLKQLKPMLSYLEEQIGRKIEIRYSASYAEILGRFQKGEVDLAYLGPLPYVTLRSQYADAIPLVHFLEQSGQASYTCALVGNSPNLPKKVKNQRFALTQPLSTCGYLSTDGLLHQAGSSLAQNKYRYLDKHDEVALAVARGDFEFGGLKTEIARKYAHLGVQILAETAPMPSFALIANGKRLPQDTQERLRQALIRLQAQGADQARMAGWGRNVRYGAVPALDRDYDVVRQLQRKIQIPQEGNF